MDKNLKNRLGLILQALMVAPPDPAPQTVVLPGRGGGRRRAALLHGAFTGPDLEPEPRPLTRHDHEQIRRAEEKRERRRRRDVRLARKP